MKKNIRNFAMTLMFGASVLTACTDSFEEINTDPDRAEDVPTTNLLAYSLYYTGGHLYDRWFSLDEPMTFGAYAAKMAYIDESRYDYRVSTQENNWTYVYRILNNIMDIQSRSAGTPNMMNVAKVLEVQTMQIATDRWRDVPYTDAVKMKEGMLQPTYNTQEEIYPALLDKLKEAADGFAAGASDALGEGDLLFKGDVSKWQKYCNSLRLRLALRISEVAPELARQTVEEVLGNPDRYPIMQSNDDNAFFWWIGTDPNYYEPFADGYRTRQAEYCASDVVVDNMTQREDPRCATYFQYTIKSVAAGNPVYKGYTIGAQDYADAGDCSIWGSRFFTDLDGFSPFMRIAEVWFHIAEASYLGWNTGTTAEEAYYKAVNFSMEENMKYLVEKKGMAQADADAAVAAYLEGAGKYTGDKKQIYYEEWVAMFKQGMEGWSLYRRTGVPENNYIAPGRSSKYADHNVPPFRSPYPDKERNLNTKNCKPFDDQIVDNLWGKQMWWDTRAGVY